MKWLGLLVIAACGRLDFGTTSHADGADGDGSGSGSGSDGAPIDANRVFVTRDAFTGGFGGLAAADTKCTNLATAAGIPGKYVAWLSSTGVSARDRLAGVSGWVRADGAPVASTVADWLTLNRMFNPIAADEFGDAMPPSVVVWTGTRGDGTGPLMDCQDWASSMSNQSGGAGNASGAVGDLAQYSLPACSAAAHLYCFQVDRVAFVDPKAFAGRRAFVTKAARTTTLGLAGLDQMCNGEAMAAGITGEFAAAVATTGASIKSRFTLDARPWVRVDGTVIAASGEALFSGAPLASFINQDAAGDYQSAVSFIWTGATSPSSLGIDTCTDWTSVSGNDKGSTGRAGDADPVVLWNQGSSGTCNNNAGHILCLEK